MNGTRFCVLSNARSGSTALCALLRQHPDVICHREIFSKKKIFTSTSPALNLPHTVEDRDRDPLGFLSELERRSLEHRPVFGFKLLFAQQEVALQHVLASEDYRIVMLSRDNTLAQYSSLLIAQATGVWHRSKHQPASEAVRVEFEPDRFRRFSAGVRQLQSDAESELRRRNREWFAVEYKEIADPGKAWAMFEFLGLEPTGQAARCVRTMPQVKQNTPRILDRFSNPDDVAAAMREIGCEAWLDEESPRRNDNRSTS